MHSCTRVCTPSLHAKRVRRQSRVTTVATEKQTFNMSSQKHAASGPYAIIVTGNLAEPLVKKYGDYAAMFLKLLKDGDNEVWDTYYVFEKDSPTDETLAQYKALVLTGSSADSYRDPDWNVQLKARLASAVKRQQRILGICYGHQLMARVLGGETGRASDFEGGPRTMIATSAFFSQWFVQPEKFARDHPDDWRFNIHETHSDVVTSMPPNVTLLASSEFTYCEVMSYHDFVLGLQGHPEFTAEFQTALIEYRLQQGTLSEKQAQQSFDVLKGNPVSAKDYSRVQSLLKTFLKS